MCTTDEILWQKFRGGDQAAFLALYDQYFPVLFRYCKQLTPSIPLVEDTIHDLFVSLWDHRHQLGTIRSMQSYLITSVRRQLLKALKNDKSEELTDTLQIPPFELIADSTLQFDLMQALQELNEKQREVLYLKFYNGLSYYEIAEIMDIQIDTVYKIARRSLTKLKKRLLIAKVASISTGVSLLTIIDLFILEINSIEQLFC